MNTYLIMDAEGQPLEIEADFYERDGEDWVFITGAVEVLRIPTAGTIGISKAR
jgi:hypothetical protein